MIVTGSQGQRWRAAATAVMAATVVGVVWAAGAATPALAADGALDPSFGTGGIVIKDFAGGDDFLEDTATQMDGKIVGVGGTLLARFNEDGSLDTAFGSGGLAVTPANAAFNEVAVQPDGRIVIAGGAFTKCAVARFNADGTLDTTFGTGGVASIDFVSRSFQRAAGLVLDHAGRIVLQGTVKALTSARTDLVTMRLTPAGEPDKVFNGNGIRFPRLSFTNTGRDLALQPDGKILVVGSERDDYVVIRYTQNSGLDFSFNGIGSVTSRVPGIAGPQTATAVAVAPDGGVLITVQTAAQNFTVVRYRADGTLDTVFGVSGIATGADGISSAMAIQPDGGILLAGAFSTNAGSGFAVQRFNSDGTVDQTFGTNGSTAVVFSPDVIEQSRRVSMNLQDDTRIVVGATLSRVQSPDSPTHDWALARFGAAAPPVQ
jgi:uncharacterized delta-60 repeat protein